MKIYLSNIRKGANPLKEKVWFPNTSKLRVPYVELEVKVVRRERDFAEDRKKTKKLFGFLKRSS